jgi:hypothetical protein
MARSPLRVLSLAYCEMDINEWKEFEKVCESPG